LLTLPANRPQSLSSQIVTSVIQLTVHSFTIHPVGQSNSEKFLKMCNNEMTYRIGSWNSPRMSVRSSFNSQIKYVQRPGEGSRKMLEVKLLFFKRSV